MSGEHKSVLERIARSNPAHTVGPGFDPKQFVPAFKIHNRSVADRLAQKLRECGLQVQCRRARLATEFFVPAEDLQRSLELKAEFLLADPDTPLRTFSRDYDAVILLLPVLVIASIIVCMAPAFLPQSLVAVWVTGISAMVIWERINRQTRLRAGWQVRLRELFLITAIIACNLAMWRWVVY